MDANLHARDWIGRTVTVRVDRPVGSAHPKHPEIRYPLNYGYLPGVPSPDGEDLDAYILGPDAPITGCEALVIAIVRRRDDVEDKLVTVAEGYDDTRWDARSIMEAVAFQEQFHDSWLEMPDAPPPVDDTTEHSATAEHSLAPLREDAARLGLPLDEAALGTFEAYLALLLEWNERAGLTAVTDPVEVQHRHFGESLALLAAIRDTGILAEAGAMRVADLGPGGGFPGVPMRIAAPSLGVSLHLTLIESNQRRAEFLRHLAATLDLADVEVVAARAEDAGRDPALREQFDLVVVRALAPLAVLVEYALPLLRLDGVLAAPKGSRAADELRDAEGAIAALGGVALVPLPLSLPEGAPPQTVLLVRREGALDSRYPRRAGMPAKRPLT